MSGKIITAVTAAILLASTALVSAQTREHPRYWGGGGYCGPGTPEYAPPTGYGGDCESGYYNYAPGHDRGAHPYYNDTPGHYNGWDRRNYGGQDRRSD